MPADVVEVVDWVVEERAGEARNGEGRAVAAAPGPLPLLPPHGVEHVGQLVGQPAQRRRDGDGVLLEVALLDRRGVLVPVGEEGVVGHGHAQTPPSRWSQASRSAGAMVAHALVVVRQLAGAQQRRAVPRDAVAEEGRRVLQDAEPVGGRRARGLPHRLEGGGPDQPGPACLVDGDPEPRRQPAHGAVEVGEQVVVVHQHDVGRAPASPGVGEVQHGAGEGVEPLPGIALPVDEPHQPLVQRWEGRAPGLGVPGELRHAPAVDVGAVVVERDRHVERVAAHHDVGHPVVERHAVERGVRLDDAPTLLRGQAGEHLVDRPDQVVEPGGEDGEAIGQVHFAVDEQEADHLDPGGAGLGPGADHDVARPEGKAPPAGAVLVGRGVAVAGCGRRRRARRSVPVVTHASSIADGVPAAPWPRQPLRTRGATRGQWRVRRLRAQASGGSGHRGPATRQGGN